MIFNFDVKQIFSVFQLKDVLDIIFISLIIYFVLVVLIKTRFYRPIFGLFILFLFYFLILFLDLPLSKYFFNYFFQILAIILIVVFHRELRKIFELAFFPRLKRLKIKTYQLEHLINDLLEAILWFQKTKTGALIVLAGSEPLDDYLEGGYDLNGKLSAPLLMSIFDKNSPGHDGAVIIELDKILKFGVHLPLAENLELVKNYGTRHRAGLGISEKTDALVIIVSEETGNLSLAQKGELKQITNLNELKNLISDFLKEKYTPKLISSPSNLLKNYLLPGIISLFLALISWYFFSFQATIVQKSFLVPVEFYNLSEEMVLDEVNETQVFLVLQGKEQDFKLLDEKNLKVSIDVSQLSPGRHRVLIRKENIKNIKNFELVKVEPSTIKFYLKVKEKEENKNEGRDLPRL